MHALAVADPLLDQVERIRTKLRARGIALNPTLSEEAVQAFEARHAIRLPAEYRLYVLELGDGGPGPIEYGVQPLGTMPMAPTPFSDLSQVCEPFPFTRVWLWDFDEPSNEGSQEDIYRGGIYLGTDGCAMDWHLIITGPERGIPWMLADEGIQPPCPRRHFLQWYEDWLDGRGSFYGFPSE